MNSRQIAKYNKDIKDLNQSRNKTKKKTFSFHQETKNGKEQSFISILNTNRYLFKHP